MTPRLRTLIDHVSRSAEPDAVLLRKFADTRDAAAFAELVRRYGRLVWGQCRHLLPGEADADDAFQATFFTLATSARTLRDTNKLGPWLHGVAYRVCLNARRLAARRIKREKATAKAEATRPVADSAWDQAFAAVHDELAKLPDTLRVPFVLCVLEGKGTTEAAEQLGLKLGTFSARLSRAKQTLFERLNARGLTAGLAAVGAVAVGATTAPAAVAAKACELAAGDPVSANILSLTHGVLGMVTMNAKRWALAAMLGCGLAAGGAGVWQANAQDRPNITEDPKPKVTDPKPKPTAADELLRLEAEAKLKQFDALKAADALQKAQAEADLAAKKAADERAVRRGLMPATPTPEFLYLGQSAGYAPTAAELEKAVKDVEAKGYTFVGVVTMKGQTKKGDEAVPTLVFRRTASRPSYTAELDAYYDLAVRYPSAKRKGEDPLPEENALRAQIEQLQRQLADLRAKEKASAGNDVGLMISQLGGTAESGSQFVTQLVRLKYGEKAAGGLSFDTGKDTLVVKGLTKEQAVWLSDTVNGISGGPGKSPK